ncbi:MAG: succinate--CoA ligase subunit beta, partial [Bifidobacterium sp.]|nr:succinate--CoA ligase subunit beta [Bifidobacterium sp.]
IVVRFDGNEAAEGLDLLAKAQQPRLKVARTMEEAADQAVALAAQAGKETGR